MHRTSRSNGNGSLAARALLLLGLAAPPLAGAAHDPHEASAAPSAAAAEVDPAAFYERLRALEGDFLGKSTKGWVDRTTFRTIAAGSAVMDTSFDAHPGETMITMYHLDGDRLLLTHYCVAKNQPRLVATEFSSDGRSATFNYLDATGIPSRDVGHMDKVVMTFLSPDEFTARWTWYEAGTETWMEEILYRRVAEAPEHR